MGPFLIAVSYASEQRYYVEKFVKYLKRKKISVYYDRDEQKEMVGTLLHEKLPHIYTEDTKYRIIFLSKEYIKKPITKMESEFILAQNVYEKNQMYVFKFEDLTLPGLNRNFVYSSISEFPNPEQYAEFIYSVVTNKTINSIETSIYYILKNKIIERYNDIHNIQLIFSEQNNIYSVQFKMFEKTILFFQIEHFSDGNLRIWLYPFFPFDKEYSYNAFVEIKNQNGGKLYTVLNTGAFKFGKPKLDKLDENNFIDTIITRIDEIIEDSYGK